MRRLELSIKRQGLPMVILAMEQIDVCKFYVSKYFCFRSAKIQKGLPLQQIQFNCYQQPAFLIGNKKPNLFEKDLYQRFRV